MSVMKNEANVKKTRRVTWRGAAYWTGWFLAWVFGLIVTGAILGAITFPIGGLFIKTDRTAGELVVRGARFLSFIFMIWAPAVALVMCTMKAWKRNAARERARARPDATGADARKQAGA